MKLTSYAQPSFTEVTADKSKFDLLNQRKVFIRQEQIEEVIALPDSVKKSGNL